MARMFWVPDERNKDTLNNPLIFQQVPYNWRISYQKECELKERFDQPVEDRNVWMD